VRRARCACALALKLADGGVPRAGRGPAGDPAPADDRDRRRLRRGGGARGAPSPPCVERPAWAWAHSTSHIISHITHHITYHITYHVAYHITCHIVARQHPRFVESHSVRLITWQIIQPVSGGAVIRKLGLHTLHRCIANASPISASIKHHQIYRCTLATCAVRMRCQPQRGCCTRLRACPATPSNFVNDPELVSVHRQCIVLSSAPRLRRPPHIISAPGAVAAPLPGGCPACHVMSQRWAP
jgi:hypothetical protein